MAGRKPSDYERRRLEEKAHRDPHLREALERVRRARAKTRLGKIRRAGRPRLRPTFHARREP